MKIIIKNILVFAGLMLFVLQNQLSAQVIVIDPGHGYTASGADPDGRTATEHATALAVGLKLRNQIQNGCSGWTVGMTRTTANGWTTLSQRRTMSNSWGADRFISIHCNGGGGTGTETFWCNRSNSTNANNSAFSREVQNRMVEKGNWLDRRSVEDATYIFHLGVLSGNNAIGVLSEIGFVDSGDATKLLNDGWRDKFAEAYLVALQNSLGSTCSGGGGGSPSDTQAPTTSISATGGNTQSGDFTANFNDNDNVGVTRRFYQALEKYGSVWYANRGNGFFNDNYNETYTGYTYGAGSWSVSGGHLVQSNTSSDNTKISSFLSQASGLPYLYEFSAKIESTSGARKFGIHIMADDASQSQRGNSYLVWFSGADNKLRIYKTVNNVLNFKAIADVPLDNNWANYKITYSPSFGVLEVFRNNQSVLTWTDSSPISSGNSISLRTNTTQVRFDDLKVYKFRAGSSIAISAGSSVTKDLRTATAKVKSLVRDDAGNWSTPGNLDMTLTFSGTRQDAVDIESGLNGQRVLVFPNPTDGRNVSLSYMATGNAKTVITLFDGSGKSYHSIIDLPDGEGNRVVNVSSLFDQAGSGMYWIQINHNGSISSSKVIKR